MINKLCFAGLLLVSIVATSCQTGVLGRSGDSHLKLMMGPSDFPNFKFTSVGYGQSRSCMTRAFRGLNDPPYLIVVNQMDVCSVMSDAQASYKKLIEDTTTLTRKGTAVDKTSALAGLSAEEVNATCYMPILRANDPKYPQYLLDNECKVMARYGKLVISLLLKVDSHYPMSPGLVDLVMVLKVRDAALKQAGARVDTIFSRTS